MKYFWINYGYAHDLITDNYKIFLIEIKEELNVNKLAT